MFARGQQDDVLVVMEMVERVARLRSDAGQVALPLEHEGVFAHWRHRVGRQLSLLGTQNVGRGSREVV